MSLPVVITPLTVTVATTELDEDQLKFPLPPWAWGGKASPVSPPALPRHPSLSHTSAHTCWHCVTAWRHKASANVRLALPAPLALPALSPSGPRIPRTPDWHTRVCTCPDSGPRTQGHLRAQAAVGRPQPQSRDVPAPPAHTLPTPAICREVKDSPAAFASGAGKVTQWREETAGPRAHTGHLSSLQADSGVDGGRPPQTPAPKGPGPCHQRWGTRELQRPRTPDMRRSWRRLPCQFQGFL